MKNYLVSMNIFDKEEFTIEDIQWLIDNQIEESINLDFKGCGSIGKSDGKKKEISKDVSAFANSAGGLIIYGLMEENHKANSFSFIDGNVYTKEWLEHVINSNITKRINDLKIIPIRNNGKIEETIYIVKIPESDNSPHMSKDGRFYKRFNFESQIMQEFEIRQLYNKLKKTVLDFFEIRINGGHIHERTSDEIFNIGQGTEFIRKHVSGMEMPLSLKFLGYDMSILIKNIGQIPENRFKLLIECPIHSINGKPMNDEFKYNEIKSPPYSLISNSDTKTDLISIEPQATIYPDEVFEVWKCSIFFSQINSEFIMKNPMVNLKLHFSNGNVSKTINLLNELKYNGVQINENILS